MIVSGLKVLYVIDGLGPGGAERSLAALAPHYRNLGVELDVAVLFERRGFQEEILHSGAQIFSFAGTSRRSSRTGQLATLMRRVRPDLVHTTLFEADVAGRIAARMSHVPVVSSLVSESYGPEHAAEPGVRTIRLGAAQVLDSATARLTCRMHAVSEQVATVMARRLRYPTGRITVVPRGRDPHTLGRRTPERRDAARITLGVADEDVVILAVGRHEPPKALDVVVDAVAQLRSTCPHARLFVAGREGSATDAVQRAIASCAAGAFVTLLGQRSDIPDLLCAADVFVLPSRREGMPGAMIEAMALEVPIVASDLPQIREVAGTDSALLAPVDRASRFAEGILQCIEDPRTAHDRVERAHARFLDNFTVERTAQRMVAFYEQALTEPRRRWHDDRSS